MCEQDEGGTTTRAITLELFAGLVQPQNVDTLNVVVITRVDTND